MNCALCEERLSDYLENTLRPDERQAVDLHLRSCPGCEALMRNMVDIMEWGRAFPEFQPPPWLATRILAKTPRRERETWLDTLVGMGRWLIEPRTAMALFTATLVLSWMGNTLGIVPVATTVARDPAAIYYGAGNLLNRAYDEAVRRYYRTPLVIQIQSQIDRLTESSS